MKTIGLIGGMSWESSAEYYRILNRAMQARLGGVHSADVLLTSFDFAVIEVLQREGRWDEATMRMIDAAWKLERGGAGVILICANTMHRMFDEVEKAVSVPMIHIVDPSAEKLKVMNVRRAGLLGTAYTMEQEFYRARLKAKGIEAMVPGAEDRAIVHGVIFDELVKGKIEPRSREAYRAIIARLIANGAEAIILGCTELPLLVKEEDSAVPLIDTTTLHAMAAVEFALG